MRFKPQPPTKSSYSNGSGACVVVEITGDAVRVTNSRGDVPFTHAEWEAHVRAIQAGEHGADQLA